MNQKILLILNHIFLYHRNIQVTRNALAGDMNLPDKQVIKALDKITKDTGILLDLIRERYPDEALMTKEIWEEPRKKD